MSRLIDGLTANRLSAGDRHAATYRPDIDGLRAVAVLAVVFNHLGIPGFFGGYVGVDVFFVISGYLITGILWRELSQGSYSLAKFYRRRVLRILPAFYVALAGTVAAACVWMLPSELVRFSRSAIAAELFASNIYFYATTDYFAPAAAQQALLHTWSLAIEEQFYIFWPLILSTCHRLMAQKVRIVTVVLIAVSLGVAILQVRQDPTGAFFLLPPRAWELLIGGFVALAPTIVIKRRLAREALAALAFGAIILPIKFYTEITPFPGAAALPPCLGTAVLIALHRHHATLTGRYVLSNPLALFVGRVSFSLYLWHWPIIVFGSLGLLLARTPQLQAAEFMLSVAAAWLSWRFVEQPFRGGAPTRVPAPRLLAGTAMFIVAATILSGSIWYARGFPQRFTPEQNRLAAFEAYDGDRAYRGGTCFAAGQHATLDPSCLQRSHPDGPAILLLGDSHAAHLWPGLAANFPNADILEATMTGCRPVISAPRRGEPDCKGFFRTMLTDWLSGHPVGRVLLAGRWAPSDLADLDATLKALRGSPVVLVGPIPQYTTALPRLLVRELQHPSGIVAGALRPDIVDLDSRMKRIAAENQVPYISLIERLCDGKNCLTMTPDGTPLQFDYGHLTVEGSTEVVRRIADAVKPAPAGP